NGAAWDPEVRITSDAPRLGNNAPSIAVAAGSVHVAFFRKPSPDDQIWYARSTDDGTTFPHVLQLTPTSSNSAMRPSVAVFGQTVEVMSSIIIPNTGAFLVDSVSSTGGTSFDTNIVPASNGEALHPSLIFDANGTAHAVYVDHAANSTMHQVFYMKR